MANFRNKRINFSQIPNSVLRDYTLSRKAKGLYCEIYSYITIPNFKLSKSYLISKGLEGTFAFDNIWNELKKAGYLKQYRISFMHEDGKTGFRYEYDLLDEPDISTPYLINIKINGEKGVEHITSKKIEVTPKNQGTKNIEIQENRHVNEKSTSGFLPPLFSTTYDSYDIGTCLDISNTDLNNTDLNNTNLSIVTSSKLEKKTKKNHDDGLMDQSTNNSYVSMQEKIKDNISYNNLIEKVDKKFVDNVVEIMTDNVCTDKEYITINDINKPQWMIKDRLLEVRAKHVEKVYHNLQSKGRDIKSPMGYYLACLMNSINQPTEINETYPAKSEQRKPSYNIDEYENFSIFD